MISMASRLMAAWWVLVILASGASAAQAKVAQAGSKAGGDDIDPRAVAVYEAGIRATSKLKSIELTATRTLRKADAAAGNDDPSSTIRALLRFSPDGNSGWKTSGALIRRGASSESEERLSYDGTKVLVADVPTKAYWFLDEKQGRAALLAHVPSWFFASSMIQMKRAESPDQPGLVSARMSGADSVDGQACETVTISRRFVSGTGHEMLLTQRIAFSKADALPRRIESRTELASQSITADQKVQVETYSTLKIDAPTSVEAFSTAAPPGFRPKSDTVTPTPAQGPSIASPPRGRTPEYERAKAAFLMALAEKMADERRVDFEQAYLDNLVTNPAFGGSDLEVKQAPAPNPEIQRAYDEATRRFLMAGGTEAEINGMEAGADAPIASDPTPPAAKAARKGPRLLGVGDPAPRLDVESFIKGDRVGEFAKGRIYVLDFWASWCGPCRSIMPRLTELQAKYRNDVTVIGVNVWEDKEYTPGTIDKVRKFVSANSSRMGYAIAYDGTSRKTDRAYLKAAGQEGIPTVFVIDRSGVIAYVGHPSDSEFDSAIGSLMAGTFDMEAAKRRAARK